jgi:hypothetical protein
MRFDRSSHRYRAIRNDQAMLRGRIRELAAALQAAVTQAVLELALRSRSCHPVSWRCRSSTGSSTSCRKPRFTGS